MTHGTLFGVGVGPGAPDLLTVRAVNVLRAADVLAIPRSNKHRPSLAWRTAEAAIGDVPGQAREHFVFPMSKDPARLIPAWEIALEAIGDHLAEGSDVAFPTMGDPFLYSTFQYLWAAAGERWPQVRREVVPGVSSLTAVPIAAGVPIADGRERIAVLPATWGVDDLERILREFDTVLLMKVGSALSNVRAAIARVGLDESSVYVSRASMQDERVERDLASIDDEGACDYFSMVVVRRGERAGVLFGQGEVGRRQEGAS
ncbi:MAG: precorrin-2 C(20)-methyltransferase [Planctomycetota bacterium]